MKVLINVCNQGQMIKKTLKLPGKIGVSTFVNKQLKYLRLEALTVVRLVTLIVYTSSSKNLPICVFEIYLPTDGLQ